MKHYARNHITLPRSQTAICRTPRATALASEVPIEIPHFSNEHSTITDGLCSMSRKAIQPSLQGTTILAFLVVQETRGTNIVFLNFNLIRCRTFGVRWRCMMLNAHGWWRVIQLTHWPKPSNVSLSALNNMYNWKMCKQPDKHLVRRPTQERWHGPTIVGSG